MNQVGTETMGANSKAPRKHQSKKDKQPHTLASINKLIEAKQGEAEAIQAEIESLTAQRNELFFNESAGLGLISLMTDPSKAQWLAGLIKESAQNNH